MGLSKVRLSILMELQRMLGSLRRKAGAGAETKVPRAGIPWVGWCLLF